MTVKRALIIVGAGGSGVEALWVNRRLAATNVAAYRVIGFADDDPALRGQLVGGQPVLGPIADCLRSYTGRGIHFHCAIGNNKVRMNIAQEFEAAGFLPTSLIDPTAVVAETSVLGLGCYVAPLAVVSPFAQLGRHVLVNTHASIGHHCQLGDFAQVCPGGRVSGNAVIGQGGFLGSNAVVAPGVSIGDWATLGAASFALRTIADGTTAVGTPARVVMRGIS